MSKSFRGISTRHFMSPRDRSALSRDYCANCVDLMVLSYTRILNGTKHLKTGTRPLIPLMAFLDDMYQFHLHTQTSIYCTAITHNQLLVHFAQI